MGGGGVEFPPQQNNLVLGHTGWLWEMLPFISPPPPPPPATPPLHLVHLPYGVVVDNHLSAFPEVTETQLFFCGADVLFCCFLCCFD